MLPFFLVFTTLTSQTDSARLITSDIPNFWRAHAQAAGKDSAEQVRIFQTVYLQPGSPGLHDWIVLRLMDRGTVRQRMLAVGWRAGQLDSLSPDSLARVRAPFAQRSAAEGLVHAIATFPRYFVIGNLSTGGTVGRSGMLIGTEQYGSGPDTPRDELPEWARVMFRVNNFATLPGLVIHEAVHTQQKGSDRKDTLLRHALGEGIADLLSELAIGPWHANTPRQIYGRAHEHDVWVDFQDEMATDSTIRMWMYNGMVSPEKNHGAIDIGYWVGYAIAKSYYNRASDKRAAVRELLLLPDEERLLAESGYNP